ncbi:hypothetical protein ATANTOWER_026727, partial [Ataeniobius toweri]|nr:hypothetical protein [Ataeniobius toweri]
MVGRVNSTCPLRYWIQDEEPLSTWEGYFCTSFNFDSPSSPATAPTPSTASIPAQALTQLISITMQQHAPSHIFDLRNLKCIYLELFVLRFGRGCPILLIVNSLYFGAVSNKKKVTC